VSDTAAENPAADVSGPTIREIVSSTEGYNISNTHCCIVPDEKEEIVRVATLFCTSGEIDWMITTGGTGFGVRDVTPEARSAFL
jgi:gephyrin